MIADVLFTRPTVQSRSLTRQNTKDRIIDAAAANNGDFIVRFNPRYRPGPALSPNYDDDDEVKEVEAEGEAGTRTPTSRAPT